MLVAGDGLNHMRGTPCLGQHSARSLAQTVRAGVVRQASRMGSLPPGAMLLMAFDDERLTGRDGASAPGWARLTINILED